jgi:hypothetical protein
MRRRGKRTKTPLLLFAPKRCRPPIFGLFPDRRVKMSIIPCFSPGINDVIIYIFGVWSVNPSVGKK